jgi:hypothetical protein
VTVMVSVLATLLFGLAPGLLNTISGLGGGQ